jgi:hypothetical protein|tara:strand:+ start:181 stop:327 length:147 start_codon:yes stop_codon:yes gene_type:complete
MVGSLKALKLIKITQKLLLSSYGDPSYGNYLYNNIALNFSTPTYHAQV